MLGGVALASISCFGVACTYLVGDVSLDSDGGAGAAGAGGANDDDGGTGEGGAAGATPGFEGGAPEASAPDAGPATPDATAPRLPLILGHRGYASNHATIDYPENSLLSAGVALAAGADGLEIDVMKTKDDVLVMAHDDELSTLGPGQIPKTDCSGKITESVWADIAGCHTQSSSPTGHTDPLGTLEGLLRLGPMELLILDVKNDQWDIDRERTIELISEKVMAADATGYTVFMLYEAASVEQATALGHAACIKRHSLNGRSPSQLADDAFATGAWGQCANSAILSDELMTGLGGHGLEQATYLLAHDLPEDELRQLMQSYVRWNVFGLMTDMVVRARDLRNDLVPPPE